MSSECGPSRRTPHSATGLVSGLDRADLLPLDSSKRSAAQLSALPLSLYSHALLGEQLLEDDQAWGSAAALLGRVLGRAQLDYLAWARRRVRGWAQDQRRRQSDRWALASALQGF